MKRVSRLSALLLPAMFGLLSPLAAQAATYTWNFSNPTGLQTSPKTYADTTNAVNIVAYSYDTTNNAPTSPSLGQTWKQSGGTYSTGTTTVKGLYGKNDGPGETGLGQDNLSTNNGNAVYDHEIQNDSFVTLDLQDLITKGLSNFTMGIGSIQNGEGYYIWGSNVLGTPGTLLRKFNATDDLHVTDTFLLPSFGTYRYISVSATTNSGDVLITDGATAIGPAIPLVPEPASAGLVILASGALLFSRRSRESREVASRE